MFQVIADFLVVLHLGFIIFVAIGGFFVLRWRWVVYLHLPAVVWGTFLEILGWRCPLTAMEQYFKQLNGLLYHGEFVEHYILPLVYPPALTRKMQIYLGISVALINGLIYGCLIAKYYWGKGEKPDR